MNRDVNRLAAGSHDVVIVGGGIYGACAAWDAALRGLSVALIEQDDFGGATSANTQRIVHGGLRYLQSFDLARMRSSIRERRVLLRIAPHLVHPMPMVLPTYRRGLRRKALLAAACAVNDWIGWDRNDGLDDPAQQIAGSRALSIRECLRLVPGLPQEGLTGGILWFDGQMANSERLTLSFILSAAEAGAEVANYVRATGLQRHGGRVAGIHAEDRLTGRRLTIRSRVVLNAAGPWAAELVPGARVPGRGIPARWVKAMNLVTRSLTTQGVAFGIPSRPGSTTNQGNFFVTPWRGRSIVGTAYRAFEGPADQCQATEEEIEAFLRDVNAAYPAGRLTRADVLGVQTGLVPAAASTGVRLARRHRIIDHGRREGLKGMLSIVGVKYTTARAVAEQAIDQVFRLLGKRAPRSLSHAARLSGGEIGRLDQFLDEAVQERLWELSGSVLRHLASCYGTSYRRVLRLIRENLALGQTVPGSADVIQAEVVYSVRQEMAVKLSDALLRRTDIAACRHPGEACLFECAALMAAELGWDEARLVREVHETQEALARLGLTARESVAEPAGMPAGVGG